MSFDAVAELCRRAGASPIPASMMPVYQIVFEERKEKNPCSLCAKLRRGSLNTALTAAGHLTRSRSATTTTTRSKRC